MVVIRHCLQSALAGALAGLIAVIALLCRDCGHIRWMIWHDPNRWVAVAVLTMGFVSTFAVAACCGTLVELARDE
jgi:hypothetical protein